MRAAGDIIMRHLPGIMNSSDALTKAVTTILHHRHTRRAMGHYQLVSEEAFNASLTFLSGRSPGIEAGEGVGAKSGIGSMCDPCADLRHESSVVVPSTE